MKKLIASLLIIMTCASGCTSTQKQDTGLVAGGVIGGAAASAISGGNAVATVAGAVGGAFIGDKVAQ